MHRLPKLSAGISDNEPRNDHEKGAIELSPLVIGKGGSLPKSVQFIWRDRFLGPVRENCQWKKDTVAMPIRSRSAYGSDRFKNSDFHEDIEKLGGLTVCDWLRSLLLFALHK